ncbi:MAG TPA: hypothetical protein VGN83_24800 [Falsiroseomonas sp.]|jgi:hypothetical protein|nr:hypothetical protein [Falsiroseomonas sp.]
MGRLWQVALVAALLLPGLSAQAQQPQAVAGATAEAMAECRSAGGNPSLRAGFETVADLNGDGVPDHLLDYTHLNCEGAASYFCGSAGCPLVAFLSGPRGHAASRLGHVRAWSLDLAGALPVLVLQLHGGSCGRAGFEGCEVRTAWNGRELARVGTAPPAVAAPSVALPAPAAPSAGEKGPAPAADAMPSAAWQVRRGGDGRPIAVAAGPGVVQAVTVFCHQRVPVMALALRARPPAGPVTLGLAGRARRAAAPLRPGGGNSWLADLRGTALPHLLAGSDASVLLTINGGIQGRLSLQGSTRAVREALAGCPAK